jgi:diguanylate cyclase (GGDEF)-like protein
MAVPLACRGTRLGILLFASARATAYGGGQAEIAAALADQAMIAYQNAALFVGARQAATVDGLTGIANRRHLFELADRAVVQARERGSRLVAIMIDIDRFKNVNDSYGHRVGDEVIQVVAARLRRHARENDVLGRYGGEEFTVVLDVEDEDESGAAIAERLRRAVVDTAVPTTAGALAVTISLGVADLEASDTGVDTLLARADQSLYRAKRAGRNRVHLASEPTEPVPGR